MKKFILFIALSIFVLDFINGQITDYEKELRKKNKDSLSGWKINGLTSINFSQSSLINWAAGGQNNISANGLISFSANYLKNKNSWDNSLDIGYGMFIEGKENLRKTDDRIELFSKYGREISKNLYMSSLLTFKTQMTPGYNYPNDSVLISDFMSPAYLHIAAGIDYKPVDFITAFVSPITGKFTFVTNQTLADSGSFGVEPAIYDSFGNIITKGKNTRAEMGGYIRIALNKDITDNITLKTKLDLFSNYLHKPQNLDVDAEILLSMKITKFITANFYAQIIYDDDVIIEIDSNNDGIIDKKGPRMQFKEIFGIGFSYKFDNKK
ncbi:MAG: DUF3078 domain-containing protein [Bacteroidales bacterium]